MQGGLGNQMFQYALGLSLSLEKNTPLLLKNDCDAHNGLELKNAFNLDENIASQADIKKVLGLRSSEWMRRKMRKNSWFRSKNYILERQHNHDFNILNCPDNAYIKGYWQSEQYFIKYQDDILKAFTFKQKLSLKNQETAKKIQQNTSVSIHIRRGDYVSNVDTNITHSLMDIAYYKKAIKQLNIKNNDILYLLFSDDKNWTKHNIIKLLGNANYLIVDNNTGKQSFNDMRLMSLCSHNIIANSSFSWWSAWLNQNPDKQVIAPKKWFADGSINTDDLCPKPWVRI